MSEQVLQQQPHRAPRGALGRTALPGRACDIQVRPREVAHKFLQELGCSDGATSPPSHVAHVGKIALESLGVFIVEGHAPARVERRFTGLVQRMRQLITVGIQAAAHPAQGNHAGASQRRNVHDRCRLEARRIGERIAQHQASFRIGIENLDGLSAHAGDHVTRLHGTAVGHVFARRDQTHHVQCGL